MHDAPDGGIWFTSDSDTRMEILAPPGVRITATEPSDPFAPGAVPGWRRASLLDEGEGDPLSLHVAWTHRISTREAATLLGERWIGEVQGILIGQLHLAASVGRRPDGCPADDELARAGSIAATWILAELRGAFPAQRWEMPGGEMHMEQVPNFSDELLRRIPAPSPLVASGHGNTTAELDWSPRVRDLLSMLWAIVVARCRRSTRAIGHEWSHRPRHDRRRPAGGQPPEEPLRGAGASPTPAHGVAWAKPR
jgi:hypothetical protein